MDDIDTKNRLDEVKFHPSAICHYGNAAIMLFIAIYFFFIPLFIISLNLADKGLGQGTIPKFAFDLHHNLSPKYEKWAIERVESKQAANMSIEDISGTEWPVFGSVFYLWATESLQAEWEKDNKYSKVAPNVYAKGAIEAAAALVTDPGHAAWVKEHWGEDYLHTENIFYRMLLMGGITSYHKLLGGDKYLELLRDQVETLSKELDDSPYGLLDDYPYQCFPTDVIAAIAAIQRADSLLGTDHSDFVKRSIRGFTGKLVDETGLPPYFADAKYGIPEEARGCSSQWLVMWAPDLWPETAIDWYGKFEKHFWQKRYGIYGFREFTKTSNDRDWYFDVDSGPVIAGHGTAATAFAIGAARKNGRFDHAYPLSTEFLAISWPLPHGTLFVPRLLSDLSDAPYLGEAALLFNLTRLPVEGVDIVQGDSMPLIVYIMLFFYLAFALRLICRSRAKINRWKNKISKKPIFLGKTQVVLWAIFVIAGFIVGFMGKLPVSIVLILSAQLLPRFEKKVKVVANETSKA